MYLNAIRRLVSTKGKIRNPHLLRYATSSTSAPARPSSPSFFSWLTGERSSLLPPMQVPLDGVVMPEVLPDYVKPSTTKFKTLPNGLTIVSESSRDSAASLGLYIDCGSVYETPMTCGATHLLEKMAFKSTQNRSHLRIVREVEAIGGNVAASASREQMGYTFDAIKTYIPQMVELLVDSVRNPVFFNWEVDAEIEKIKEEIGQLSKNPQGLLVEAIHTVGYSGALANPLLVPESALSNLNADVLHDFVAEHYTAPRMVLSASGVDLDEIVSVAEPLLSDLEGIPHPGEPKSKYVGGEFRQRSDTDMAHVALAFEVPRGWRDEKVSITLTLLQILMGGGGSFSAGGPGKGMHSRLYARVLNEHPQLQSFSAFNSIFNDTGLFGIYACTTPDFASKAVDLAVSELIEIATSGKVSKLELSRAKESTKSAVLMNLESRMIVAEDIGRQFLTYRARKPVEHFLKAVDEITLRDITEIGQKIVSSPPTLASFGDVTNVPSYDSVRRMFV